MQQDVIMGWVIIISALVFGGIVIYFMLVWMKSHRLRVRDTLREKSYITDFWVFEKKDKDTGILNWVSVSGAKTLKTPKPPSNAIEVGPRGRKFAECYRVSEDEFIWITDQGIKTIETEDKNGVMRKQFVDVLEDGTHKVIDTFRPFSPVQRETIVNQFKKAQEIRNKRWTADKIVNMTAILSMTLLVIMLMVFWGDLAKPIVDMDGRITARENRLYKMEQELCGKLTGNTVVIPPTVPSNIITQGGESPPRIPK